MTGTFEGVGSLQFSPDNKYAQIFSGQVVATGGATETLFEFTTGGEYIMGELCFTENERGSNAIELKGFLNGVRIIDYEYDASPMDTRNVYPILIPPYTTFLFQFIAQGTNINGTAWFVGKVQGPIEQQNLESITDDNKWAEL